MGGFRTLFARLAERRGAARQGAFEWTPEAERMRSALEMHELGVQLYRQRMRREHPKASRAEIDGLVRGWLTATSVHRLAAPAVKRTGSWLRRLGQRSAGHLLTWGRA
jgi:Rv0078B-related antitoxin